MSDFYNIIYDLDEVKNFYDKVLAVKPLLPNEVRYVSLSVRNKYLNEEERKYYNCGRSEMFGKQVVRHDTWEAYKQALYRYECNKLGYLTKNGIPYPEKAMVCYANINPCDSLETVNEMMKSITENKDALVYAALKNSKYGISEAFHKIRKIEDTMISLYARNVGSRNWIDMDLDIGKDNVMDIISFVEPLLTFMGFTDHYWVDTKGGVHLLLKKDEMKFNPALVCDVCYIAYWLYSGYYLKGSRILFDMNNEAHRDSMLTLFKEVEIIQNKNQMVPLSGTLQGGHQVRILNLEGLTLHSVDSLVYEMQNFCEEMFKKKNELLRVINFKNNKVAVK